MSQISLNQTIVTDPESPSKKCILKNAESTQKKRPSTGFSLKCGNDDNASIGTVGDFPRVRKLGYLPSYLKKQTKSSVESELVTKYKKFKLAKKELIDQQSNLMKSLEHLKVLKDKFTQFGGRDFKIENLEIITFTGSRNVDRCGEGDCEKRIGDGGDQSSNGSVNQIIEFEREIQRIRGRVKDCLFEVIKLNSDAFKQIRAYGTEELQEKIDDIFSKIGEYVKSVSNEQDMSTQLLLENLRQLRVPLPQDVQSSTNTALKDEEIIGLKETIQNLEIRSKMLQSEVDVKTQEIEYLKNKEMVYSKDTENNDAMSKDSALNQLRSEISAQNDIINDYRNKINEQFRLHQNFEENIKQLEYKIEQQNRDMEASHLKFEADLAQERRKYEDLKMLEEAKNANFMDLQNSGSNFEMLSSQLTAANEDVKELQFKLSRREKQVQSLKQRLSSESNKTKEFDQLMLKYDQLHQKDSQKSKEIQQLKQKLIVSTDTINSRTETISELNKMLMVQGAVGDSIEYPKGNSAGPLQDGQISKFSEHERIIKKLENNKIRSNLLRDQLLDRISMLEKENEDMKAQIRKFHEDFTINRFMYDEQRRKKRLTEILVKQYQK